MTFTAIVWIGQYGSWSKAGFPDATSARSAANYEIARGVFGQRSDLVVTVEVATA